jgi:uncharacterized protein (TIGR02147 family)
MTKTSDLSVFDYTDYRAFLRDFLSARKRASPRFSLRSFCARVNPSLASSGLLSGVLNNKKNLGPTLRADFARALDLKTREAQYFELLVQFNQAGDVRLKSRLFAQLSGYRHSRAKLIYERQFRFFTQWYYAVVWNYFGVRQNVKSAAEIADALRPRLTPSQVQDAIRLLLDLGLIKRLANGYAVTENHLSTEPEFRGLEAIPYSEMFLDLAAGALHNIEPEERKFGILVFSASQTTVDRIRDKIDALSAEVQDLIDRDDHPDGIYSFCFQLFPNHREPLRKDRIRR